MFDKVESGKDAINLKVRSVSDPRKFYRDLIQMN